MNRNEIFKIIRGNIVKILPFLTPKDISIDMHLKDLGANSLDRMEIVIMSVDELGLKLPLNKLGKLKKIKDYVNIFYENQMEEAEAI